MNISRFLSRPKSLLILGIGILSLFSIFYVLSLSKKTSSPPITNVISTPSQAFSVPPTLRYTDPPPGKQESFWTTTAIEFKFDQPIDPLSVKFSVQPKTELAYSASEDKTSIFIRPQDAWKTNTSYILTIESLSNYSDLLIADPINYPFEIVPPTDIMSY